MTDSIAATTTYKPSLCQDWTTKAGLRAAVYATVLGHLCGYVAVPKGHPLYTVDYEDCYNFKVHGGLTFATDDPGYPAPGVDLWWFGFDCAHAGDGPDPQWKNPYGKSLRLYGVFRDEAYVMAECESLAQQIVEATNGHD